MYKFALLLAPFAWGLVSSAFAANDFTPFTTLQQAREYCPAESGLTFIPTNPSIPNSRGLVTGFNLISFQSVLAKNTVHPKYLDPFGLIIDAQFRNAGGLYGYISNDVITCLYTFTNFENTPYSLIMRS